MALDNIKPGKSIALLFRLSLILAALAFCGYEIWIYSGRSPWIDEISSLINYPLAQVSDIFAPLPYAQQAAPASFNLLSTATHGLSVQEMRILFSLIILVVIAISVGLAYRFKTAACVGAAAFILSSPIFFHYATELKFYGFEMAGAAVVAAWLIRYDASRPMRLIDLGVLIFAVSLGISTMVIALCATLAVL